MAEWLFVDAAGEEGGPCSAEQICRLVSSGELSETSLLRRLGEPLRYKPLLSYKPLREALRQASSHHPPPCLVAQGEGAGSSPAAQVDDVWYYRDDGDNARGPFSLEQLRELVRSGMLVPPRDVRRGESAEFIDLCQWAELWPPANSELLTVEQPGAAADYWQGPTWAEEGSEEGEGEWEAPEAEWVYLDDSNKVQGPFVTSELKGWLEQGLIDYSRKVNLAGSDEHSFRPAAEWAELRAMRSEEAAASTRSAASSPVNAQPEPSQAEKTERERAHTAYADGQVETVRQTASSEPSASPSRPASSPPASEWVYVDDNGVEQGPFPTSKLLSWVSRGLLTTDRKVTECLD